MRTNRYSLILILSLAALATAQINQPRKLSFKGTKPPRIPDRQLYVSDQYQQSEKRLDFDPILGAKFQFVLDSICVADTLVGISAAVDMPEKGLWQGADGMSDPVNGVPFRTDMLFDIGSNTKTFIAALMLKLAEEGLLTLDDQLHQWLPSYPNIDSTITIRQLLNHSSGIFDYLNDGETWIEPLFADLDRVWTPEYILTYVFEPNFPAGTSYRYSNTNYILAGMIIKKATQSEQIAPLLRQRFLDPLNLNSTFMEVEEPLVGELCHGWNDLDGDGVLDDLNLFPRTAIFSCFWTAGAMVSTTENMARWIRALHSGQVLSQASMDEMLADISLGIGKWLISGETLWGHGGGTISHKSLAVYHPERSTGIIVFINQVDGQPVMAAEKLLNVLLHYYQYPHDKVHPHHAALSSTYIRPSLDSLRITTLVNNPQSHQVEVKATITSLDSTCTDSILLFKENVRFKSHVPDERYSGHLPPVSYEKEFSVVIKSRDMDSGYRHTLNNAGCFTTLGPVTVADYIFTGKDTLPNPGDRLNFKLKLQNMGLTAPAVDVKFKMTSLDSTVDVTETFRTCGDIAPGHIVLSAPGMMQIHKNCPVSTEILVKVDIYSHDYSFWMDTLHVFIYPETRVADNLANLPTAFALHQNYPNPFNPSTTIEFALPKSSFVTLKVHNLLGEQVAILVVEKRKAGIQRVDWDAGGLASGVYLYRLEAGEFVQCRKLLLMR